MLQYRGKEGLWRGKSGLDCEGTCLSSEELDFLERDQRTSECFEHSWVMIRSECGDHSALSVKAGWGEWRLAPPLLALPSLPDLWVVGLKAQSRAFSSLPFSSLSSSNYMPLLYCVSGNRIYSGMTPACPLSRPTHPIIKSLLDLYLAVQNLFFPSLFSG